MDSRSFARLRTRIRPGKVLTETGAFLCDCAITDRSPNGARLRFFVPTPLPEAFWLFDERDGTRRAARAVWSKGSEAGISFKGPERAVGAKERERIAGPYYAVGH